MSLGYVPPGYLPRPGGQTSPFQVLAGDSKTLPLPFFCAAVGIDNPSPFYVHFVEAAFGGWVRPFTLGAIVPAPSNGRYVRVSAIDVPPPGTYSTITTDLVASCLAFEDPQPYSPGYPSTSPGIQTAFPLVLRAAGTYTFDVPAQGYARGIVVYGFNAVGSAGTAQTQYVDFDPGTGSTSNILTSTAFAANNAFAIKVYPGLTPAANQVANNVATPAPRIQLIIGVGGATAQVDYALLP